MVKATAIRFEGDGEVGYEETERCTECENTWRMDALLALNDGSGDLLCPACAAARKAVG